MAKLRALSVFGTRPEAIKMCPVVKEIVRRGEEGVDIESVVCLTGQHRQMLDQVMDVFGIRADYDLNIMKPNQTLPVIAADILLNLDKVLEESMPDIVLVHGDTSTTFAAALAAFYRQIPVGHVEAGLRTHNKYSPFPEEINRSLTGRIAELHFAPTKLNKENLFRENITKNVFITGNTVIDAFKTTVRDDYEYRLDELRDILKSIEGKRLILMTAHRRENLGTPLENICNAVIRLVKDNDDTAIIYPVHLNPMVRGTVISRLSGVERIHLIDPIDVEDMHNLIARSYLILTDSGGMQEEAPSCGVPVLVMRTETERPEAVEAGTVRVVGVDEQSIYDGAQTLLHNKTAYEAMQKAVNPYGDGLASERIVNILLDWSAGRG